MKLKRISAIGLALMPIFFISSIAHSADYGYDIAAYDGPWAAMHRDNRNSDYAPVSIADTYNSGFERTQIQQFAFNKPVIGPEGNIYYSFQGTGSSGYSQYYVGRSGLTGIRKFQLGTPEVDKYVTSGVGLVGTGGDFFLGDNSGVMRYSPDGVPLWANKTPIMGVQASGLQFTPDGKILVMTWNGWVHVIEPANGAILWEQNMTPGRTYPEITNPDFQLGLCLLNGDSGDCAYVNMPAIDPYTDSIYQTYNDENGDAYIHKYSYNRVTHDVALAQTSDPIPGGSASSIALSSDYQKLYLNGNTNELFAYDANTLAKKWSKNLFYPAKGSPIVNPNGYIVPNGNESNPLYKIQVIKDQGDYAIRTFMDTEYTPLTSASAGLNNRFVVVALSQVTGLVYLVVFDNTGIISRTEWGGDQPGKLLGTALGKDGEVYVIGLGSVSLKKFTPPN